MKIDKKSLNDRRRKAGTRECEGFNKLTSRKHLGRQRRKNCLEFQQEEFSRCAASIDRGANKGKAGGKGG